SEARPLQAGAAQLRRQQLDGALHALDAQHAGHCSERHMRGDPRGPQLAEDIDLAGEALPAEMVDREVELIARGMTGELHRLLVEWGKDDAVDPATRGLADRPEEIVDAF